MLAVDGEDARRREVAPCRVGGGPLGGAGWRLPCALAKGVEIGAFIDHEDSVEKDSGAGKSV
jgi:hypothetical protein